MFGKNTDYINSVCTQHAVHPWAFPQGWSAPKSAELWSNWATTKSGESTCGHINIFTHLQNRTWSRSLSNSMGLVLDAILKSRRGVGVTTLRYESSTSTSQELSSTVFQSLWGIDVTWPDLHFFQYIKAYMPYTDQVPSRINQYYQVPTIAVHTILTNCTASSSSNTQSGQLDLVCHFDTSAKTAYSHKQIASNCKAVTCV